MYLVCHVESEDWKEEVSSIDLWFDRICRDIEKRSGDKAAISRIITFVSRFLWKERCNSEYNRTVWILLRCLSSYSKLELSMFT